MGYPNVEVANDFFHDGMDFLCRYQITKDDFHVVRSRRLKLFLDLRMAAECVLKATVAYHMPVETGRDQLIKLIENYKHKIGNLALHVKEKVEVCKWAVFEPFVMNLDALPVGLRYRLDGRDFRESDEDLYYSTIGMDGWLEQLHDAIELLAYSLDKKLQSSSRIIASREILLEELIRPTHNKYAKKSKS